MHKSWNLTLCTALLLATGTSALADFAGQPILGPLSNGSVVAGDTTGKADDNDGFESGIHIFDIWDGGDDVWLLNWLGGDMTVSLTSLSGSDNDLFVYSPGSYDSTGDYSIVGAFDQVTLLGAPAGQYYINVDTTFFSEGPYSLAITPEPGTLSLLGLAGLMVIRRKHRHA